ncbi:MAG: reverse transcriptase-like protein [Candidatus Thiodiazotropha taylori]|nr:reverse transcriptase-like protein [Candidatus Thiodiazotropha taylori]
MIPELLWLSRLLPPIWKAIDLPKMGVVPFLVRAQTDVVGDVLAPLPSVPLPNCPVGARLLNFSAAWSLITKDTWALSVVRKGYRIPFARDPPLSLHPILFPVSSYQLPLLKEEVQLLLQKKAVEVVSDPTSPGFYSRIFLVKKKNGKLRPIIDLSPLNKMMRVDHFQMETSSSIRKAIPPGAWAVSIDLQDAYLHIPIHRASRKYLRFTLDGTVYQFRSLPFGISTAPFVFTNMMEIVASYVRSLGPSLIQYFDDWLAHHLSRATLLSDLRLIWQTIVSLGLIPNPEKSELIPSQDFTYVGMRFLTQLGIVRVPEDRVNQILLLLFRTFQLKFLSARSFLSLLGTLNAAADLVLLGRLHMRPLQFHLLSYWRPHLDSLDLLVPISQFCKDSLRWWMNPSIYLIGIPLVDPEPDFHLFSDASLSGWGAHLEPLGLMVQGSWDQEFSGLHINNLEMSAVFLALKHFHNLLSNKCVMVASDNSSVVAYLKKQGGTHSPSLCTIVWDLLYWCKDRNISIRVRHIPGKLNVIADSLSRSNRVLPSEWNLNRDVANQIFSLWKTPQLDLFATRFNNLLPLFVSPVPDHRACAVDAMSIDWGNLFAYAFPPFNLIPLVLAKIKEYHCQVILIAPLWPQRSWFPLLLSLLSDLPRCLPVLPDIVFQNLGKILHPSPAILHLHAWKLSGVMSERNKFLSLQPNASLSLVDLPLLRSIPPDGEFSLIGVVKGKLIRSIPL